MAASALDRDSPEWRRLKPRTRSDYQAVRDWLGAPADRCLLSTLSTPQVIALRDKAEKMKGRRFGNYVVQVLRLTIRPRHTIASWARGSEESEFRVAAAIGERTTAMAAAIYGRDADRATAQGAILAGIQKRFENADWKLASRPLEAASPAEGGRKWHVTG